MQNSMCTDDDDDDGGGGGENYADACEGDVYDFFSLLHRDGPSR